MQAGEYFTLAAECKCFTGIRQQQSNIVLRVEKHTNRKGLLCTHKNIIISFSSAYYLYNISCAQKIFFVMFSISCVP